MSIGKSVGVGGGLGSSCSSDQVRNKSGSGRSDAYACGSELDLGWVDGPGSGLATGEGAKDDSGDSRMALNFCS